MIGTFLSRVPFIGCFAQPCRKAPWDSLTTNPAYCQCKLSGWVAFTGAEPKLRLCWAPAPVSFEQLSAPHALFVLVRAQRMLVEGVSSTPENCRKSCWNLSRSLALKLWTQPEDKYALPKRGYKVKLEYQACIARKYELWPGSANPLCPSTAPRCTCRESWPASRQNY